MKKENECKLYGWFNVRILQRIGKFLDNWQFFDKKILNLGKTVYKDLFSSKQKMCKKVHTFMNIKVER